jgi:hypothetical protein
MSFFHHHRAVHANGRLQRGTGAKPAAARWESGPNKRQIGKDGPFALLISLISPGKGLDLGGAAVCTLSFVPSTMVSLAATRTLVTDAFSRPPWEPTAAARLEATAELRCAMPLAGVACACHVA